jgi:hypothetical protein
VDEKALFQRLDEIIYLMRESQKQPSIFIRILNMAALIVTLLSIIALIDIFRNWFGG